MEKFKKALLAGALVSFHIVVGTACGPASNSASLGVTGNPVTDVSTITICSQLNFNNVSWPSGLSANDRAAFMLALNIDGSFEGNTDWGTLSNDFDGEGMSMGLLDQTLGTGSLQPLLIEMRDHNLADMQRIFSSTHLTSLLNMLSAFQTAAVQSLDLSAQISNLDILPAGVSPFSTQESASVQWAVSNLYSDAGTTFIPEWQQELQALGRDPNYITYQIQAALAMHTQAKKYISTIGVDELRTYLFAFDIVAQDGSFYANDLSDYATYLQNNPNATDTQKLVQLLTYRLREVRPQYVADVQSRKMAMINGQGLVHGANRNLETQYCFNRMIPYQ